MFGKQSTATSKYGVREEPLIHSCSIIMSLIGREKTHRSCVSPYLHRYSDTHLYNEKCAHFFWDFKMESFTVTLVFTMTRALKIIRVSKTGWSSLSCHICGCNSV